MSMIALAQRGKTMMLLHSSISIMLSGYVMLNDVRTATTGITVQAIYQAPGKAVTQDGYTMTTTEPTILMDFADGYKIIRNETIITIDAINYQAFNSMPDGFGFIHFDLTKDF